MSNNPNNFSKCRSLQNVHRIQAQKNRPAVYRIISKSGFVVGIGMAKKDLKKKIKNLHIRNGTITYQVRFTDTLKEARDLFGKELKNLGAINRI